MVVSNDVLAMMDEEEKKAAERPSGQFVPTFLRLKDKQKARVRPLFNLDGCVVLPMHNKYNKSNPKDSINAVCSSEIGLPCPHCQAAKTDKQLSASTTFMLPVYVLSLEQKNVEGKWVAVTYKDSDDNDQLVSGLRVIELKAFGSINQVFQFVRNLHREDEKHDIRQYGLVIERADTNPKNPTYTVLPKGPSPMPDVAKNLIPTQTLVQQMVLSACPPAGAPVVTAEPPAKEKVADVDLEF